MKILEKSNSDWTTSKMKRNAVKLLKFNKNLTKFKTYQNYTYKKTNFSKFLIPLGVAAFVVVAKDFENFLPWLEAKSKEEPQDTVISGMHGNCGVAVIKLKDQKDFEEFAKICSTFPQTVEKYMPNYDKEEELKPILVGIGFDTTTWKKFSESKKISTEGLQVYKERKGQFGDLPKTEGEVENSFFLKKFRLFYT
jgi:hypothetical protein